MAQRTSGHTIENIYKAVISDVINQIKEAFLDENIDIDVLHQLKKEWEGKVNRDGTGKFNLSSIISSLLDSCNYEEILLEATLKFQEMELSRSIEQWTEQMQRGVCSVTDQCIVCQESPGKSSYLFQCGHMVHTDCSYDDRICPCQKTSLPLQPCSVTLFSAPAPYKKKRKEITLFTPAMGSLELAPSVPSGSR
ncbi:hypothetical protein QR680_005598 [Steinernema hermaphroditum]|uniref:RING-type domain-containing protein n=1 Tax=Steinernema hermaphroditum TaxID=289476 RepID=A0AA39LV60_9BILA|nr:hypothetical protein QR680_005598 [Steinernema hermaphroditum]